MALEKLKSVLNLLKIDFYIHYYEDIFIIMNAGEDFCIFLDRSSEEFCISFNVNAHPIYAATLINTLNKEGINIEIDESFYMSNKGAVFGDNAEKEAYEEHKKEVENQVKMARLLDNVDIEQCSHC